MLGYTLEYQLFVLSVVFFYLQTCSCYYSVIFYLQFIMLLLRTVCMHEHLSLFLHTHWVTFWRHFLTTLNLHV